MGAPSRSSKWLARLWVWLPIVGGGLLPFLIMASDRRWSFGVELGFLGVLLCCLGWVRLFRGRFTADDAVEAGASVPDVRAQSVLWLGSILLWWLWIYLAVAGVYPAHEFLAGLLVTTGFIGCVASTFLLGQRLGFWAKDENGEERPLLRRHGFWLLVIGSLLYLPMLGNFGLLDPWETHYGEVAREILARDDWISLWWAQDGWFWSKPVLNFWAQALSFKLFGVEYMPDQMLSGVLEGYWPQPEWAARLPLFLMTVVSVHVLYRACVGVFGRRMAFLGGLVLLTCPYWFLLARQTMADMPYVAPVTAAMGFLMLGFQSEPDARVRDYTFRLGKRRLRLNAFHLLLVVVLLTVLPQVIYLLTRNVTLHLGEPFGFRPHLDELLRGSGGGNCGQPGNKRCAWVSVEYAWGQPVLWALVWLGGTLLWLFLNRKESRTQRLYFLAAWYCTALAVLAKGAPGLVIPVAGALVYIGVTGRFRDLLRLELPGFLLLLMVVALPWYVQTFMRHGMQFIDRLILHDMVKRAFDEVHQTNKGDDTSFRYYVWQLGYGLFPWTGLAAGGLLWWGRREQRRHDPRSNAVLFLLIWWLVAFGMFSISNTKFHHYILPLVPPTAVLTGLLLARYVPRRLPSTKARTLLYYAGALLGTGLAYYGILSFLPGSILGSTTADAKLPPAKLWLGIGLLLIAAVLLFFTLRKFGAEHIGSGVRGVRSALAVARANYRNALLGVLAVCAAVPVLLAGRDMFVSNSGDLEGPIRLLHLFTYNYDRPWPKALDLRSALLAFTILCTGSVLLLAPKSLRHHAGVLFCCTAFWWTVWVSDIYLVVISPHWGQRETMIAYLQARSSPEEPLVAYQMNWKGENFYTGNRLATYVRSGKKFKRWVEKQRKKGVTTMFFTTEHSRIGTLKRELDRPENFELLTTKELNNKFVLARAVFDSPQRKK